MYHPPPGAMENLEPIELQNQLSADMDISEWRLRFVSLRAAARVPLQLLVQQHGHRLAVTMQRVETECHGGVKSRGQHVRA